MRARSAAREASAAYGADQTADEEEDGRDHEVKEALDDEAEDERLGALLFRREHGTEPQWVVVFLVAESPIGGIAEAAMRRALDYSDCDDEGSKVHVLAPAFSGSAPKL